MSSDAARAGGIAVFCSPNISRDAASRVRTAAEVSPRPATARAGQADPVVVGVGRHQLCQLLDASVDWSMT